MAPSFGSYIVGCLAVIGIVAAETIRGDDPDYGEAADYVGAKTRCHGRGMLVSAAAGARPAAYLAAAGMLHATPVPFRPQ